MEVKKTRLFLGKEVKKNSISAAQESFIMRVIDFFIDFEKKLYHNGRVSVTDSNDASEAAARFNANKIGENEHLVICRDGKDVDFFYYVSKNFYVMLESGKTGDIMSLNILRVGDPIMLISRKIYPAETLLGIVMSKEQDNAFIINELEDNEAMYDAFMEEIYSVFKT